VKVVTDIGVTREFNRHRTFSIVEQSTRYCNFSKDKFGNEITFIIPSWLKCKDIDCKSLDVMNSLEFKKYCLDKKSEEFVYTIGTCEWHYLRLLQQGLKPQEARQVLPLSTKTEVVYTAFESDWRHFFDLRLFGKTGEPHPQIRQLAELIKEEFEKADVWEGIMKYPSKYE
jgi:thymidylate synthase (FAD)